MPIKWTLFILTLFLGLSMVNDILIEGWFSDTSVWGRLFNVDIGEQSIPVIGHIWGLVTTTKDWISALWDLTTFNYVFLVGPVGMAFRYFFWCIGLAYLVSLTFVAFRGTSST